MFDIGFTELLLVGVVALVVVGPERLPRLVRTVLVYIRQFKSSFSQIKYEVERELDLDNLKDEFDSNKEQISQTIGYDEIEDSTQEIRNYSQEFENIKDDFLESNVSDDEIEKDLSAYEADSPFLPEANSEQDTGIEKDIEALDDKSKTK